MPVYRKKEGLQRPRKGRALGRKMGEDKQRRDEQLLEAGLELRPPHHIPPDRHGAW